MRFTSLLIAGVFALTASAQSASSTTDAAATGTGSSTTPTDSATAAIYQCLNACQPGDVVCQSHCITVPSPDSGAVNRTNQCVADCPTGTGTAADNQAYSTCVTNCIGQYFYTESVGTPTGTAKAGGSSASGGATSASVTAIVSTVTSGSSTFTTTMHSTVSNKASGTGATASASASSSGNAADAVFRPGSSSVGLLGFIAALLAL